MRIMRATRSASFEDFYAELADEAQAEGPAAIADLRAKEVKYALINALITRRHELNLSQVSLAAESGVAQTEISKIERGRKSPTLDTFSRLVSALKIEVLPAPKGPRARGSVVLAVSMSQSRPPRAMSASRPKNATAARKERTPRKNSNTRKQNPKS